MTIVVDQPVGGIATNKISAFDLTIEAAGAAQITQVGDPVVYPGGEASHFTAIILTIAPDGKQARIAFVCQIDARNPTQCTNATLPIALQIPVTIIGTGDLSLTAGATQEVVGVIANATDNTYQVSSVPTGGVPTGTVSVTDTPPLPI